MVSGTKAMSDGNAAHHSWAFVDGEYITPSEARLRQTLGFAYRFCLAVFISAQMFDMLFSSIWMHGYIWALNNPIEVDLSDKPAGFIVDHHLELVGYGERLIHAILSCLAVITVLWLNDYHLRQRSIWHLLALSLACGMASGFSRCVQMKHRLYPAFHEAFYIYFHFFMVGLCMTWRLPPRKGTSVETAQPGVSGSTGNN